jgi:mono/diheme cytochrome c family protein
MLTRGRLVIAGLIVLLGLVPLYGLTWADGVQEVPFPRTVEDPGVTPTVGASWLSRRGPFDRTTALVPPQDSVRGVQGTPASPRPLGPVPTLVLTGAALYRLNCEACHAGSGPGVTSVTAPMLKPVAGSSLDTIRQRLLQDAMRANAPAIIRRGTPVMPAREHLNESDLGELLVYLTKAPAAGDTQPQPRRVSSWARLGEHIVKGTCHICHDATSARPAAPDIQPGAIPSLEALLATRSVVEFVKKARSGLPVLVGDPALLHAGRMPRFDYLRDEEIAAAYLYLATYPPKAAYRD